jgi:hypothetical protein
METINSKEIEKKRDQKALESIKKLQSKPKDLGDFVRIYYNRWKLSIVPLKFQDELKRPLVKWENYQKERATPQEIESWFLKDKEKKNIGIICGSVSGNLAIVDFDDPTLFEKAKSIFPNAPVVKTSRGIHVLLRTSKPVPKVQISKEGNHLIDILGEGSIATAPPSIHFSGKTYEFLNLPEEIPVFEGDLVQTCYDLAGAQRKDRVFVNELLVGVKEGERNEATIKLATYYRKKDYAIEKTKELLLDWNRKNIPPMPEEELFATIESAYKRPEPYGYVFEDGTRPKRIIEKIISATELLKRDIPQRDFIVEGLIREKSINILGGESGSGKTWGLQDLSLCVSNGVAWLDKFATKKSNVLYCDLEEDEEENKRRIQLLSKNRNLSVDNVFFYTGEDLILTQGGKLNKKLFEELEEAIIKNDIKVVIFDTGRKIHDFNEDNAGEVNQLYLQILKPLRDNLDQTIIYVMHTRKRLAGRFEEKPEDRLRGSGEFRGMANSIIFCDGIENSNEFVGIDIGHVKSKAGKKQKPFRINVVNLEDSLHLTFGEWLEKLLSKYAKMSDRFVIYITTQKLQETFNTSQLTEWLLAEGVEEGEERSIRRSVMDYMFANKWIEFVKDEGGKKVKDRRAFIYKIIREVDKNGN